VNKLQVNLWVYEVYEDGVLVEVVVDELGMEE
jgi:hypothetical protein